MLQRSNFNLVDLDHIPDPEALWKKIETDAILAGAVFAYKTPSNHGLKIVFDSDVASGDKDAITAEQNKFMSECGIPFDYYDRTNVDMARKAFAVTEDYFCYLDEEMLFAKSKFSEIEIVDCQSVTTNTTVSVPALALPSIQINADELEYKELNVKNDILPFLIEQLEKEGKYLV